MAGRGRCWGRGSRPFRCPGDHQRRKLCQEPGAVHRAVINAFLVLRLIPRKLVSTQEHLGGAMVGREAGGSTGLMASSASTPSSWVTSSSSSWPPISARTSPPPASPPGRRWSVWWPTRWPTSTTELPASVCSRRCSWRNILWFCWSLIAK